MTWRIEIKPSAEKQYLKLDKKTRRRIKSALMELEGEENPLFHKDVKRLTGKLDGDLQQVDLRTINSWRLRLAY